MKTPVRLLPLLLIASTGALAACGDGVRITSKTSDTDKGGVLQVIETLQCPDRMGALTRKGSAQADGSVCVYGGPRGAEVSLHLVALGGDDADTVLQKFEDQLTAVMPHTAAQMTPPEPPAAPGADGDQASVRAGAVNVDAHGDQASVHMPGIHIDADGDKAAVKIGGFTINADGDDATVDARTSEDAVSVQAHDDAAQIRTRAPGEATRQTFLLTDSRPSEAGWRLVGYEARGPRGGPIVVATVRAKERNSDGVFDDAKSLVTLNVGE